MHKISFFGLDRQYKNLKTELLDMTDKVMLSGNYMNGDYTAAFETWLAIKTKTNFAITVHSGTQALEIMARWARVDHDDMMNDEAAGDRYKPIIKIPNISYVATLNAFLSTGYEVELIDTDKDGLMLDPTNTTDFNDFAKSVCDVGLYGAIPHSTLPFLESKLVDGAQHWLVAENTGDGMAISFDPTKNLPASGNGGAIVTNNRSLYDYAYSFRSNGKIDHSMIGTNSRMSELDCAHLLVRSKYLDKWQWRRKEIRHYYLDEFKNIDLRCLSRNHMIHADQKFVVYTNRRDELAAYLIEKGIDVKIHYPKALSELPIAKDIKVKPDMLDTSVMLTRGVLSLPIYPELSDAEVEYIVQQVKKYFTYSIHH